MSLIKRVIIQTPEGASYKLLPGEGVNIGPDRNVRVEVEKEYLYITHRGTPRNLGKFKWENSQPFLFTSIRVVLPEGVSPMGHPFIKAKRERERHDGTFEWELVRGQKLLPDEKNYPNSGLDKHHGITGGERIAWVFCKDAELLHPLPGSEEIERISDLLEWNGELFGRWPRADDVLSLYSGTTKSYGTNMEKGEGLDLLARMIDTSASSLGEDAPVGWYRWGDLRWASGHSNHHYGCAIHAMMGGLLNDDSFGLTLGLNMALKQAATGLVWSAGTDPQGVEVYQRGMQHYEKGNERYGSYFQPSHYKQWPLTTELAAHLWPHPLLQEARDLRRDWWLSREPTEKEVERWWEGLWGERAGGFMLNSLRAHMLFDDNQRHQSRYREWAQAIMERGFKLALMTKNEEGPHLWFHNIDRMPDKNRYPWQMATTLAAFDWWMRTHHLCSDRRSLFEAILSNWVEWGTGPLNEDGSLYTTYYEIGPSGDNSVKDKGFPKQAAFGIAPMRSAYAMGLPGVSREKVLAMERTGVGHAGQSPSNLQDYGTESLRNKEGVTWSFRGGANFCLGDSGTKTMNAISDAAFYFARPLDEPEE